PRARVLHLAADGGDVLHDPVERRGRRLGGAGRVADAEQVLPHAIVLSASSRTAPAPIDITGWPLCAGSKKSPSLLFPWNAMPRKHRPPFTWPAVFLFPHATDRPRPELHAGHRVRFRAGSGRRPAYLRGALRPLPRRRRQRLRDGARDPPASE